MSLVCSPRLIEQCTLRDPEAHATPNKNHETDHARKNNSNTLSASPDLSEGSVLQKLDQLSFAETPVKAPCGITDQRGIAPSLGLQSTTGGNDCNKRRLTSEELWDLLESWDDESVYCDSEGYDCDEKLRSSDV